MDKTNGWPEGTALLVLRQIVGDVTTTAQNLQRLAFTLGKVVELLESRESQPVKLSSMED